MISRAQRLSRATVTIDLSAVAANTRMLRDLVAPAQMWAVVKADGYGHGASAVGGAALAAGASSCASPPGRRRVRSAPTCPMRLCW